MSAVAGRQHEVSRMEGFSDAVFGFALTLLVVSLEVPGTARELLDVARQFGPFALTFAMVGWIWYEHNVFFRRYGLQDPWTTFLNLVLLFVVLFYVYPLKFLATQIVASLTGDRANWGASLSEAQGLMLIYSAGVVLIFGCFVLLYRHAYRQRERLGLAARDLLIMRFARRSHLISMSIGVLSMAIVAIDPRWSAWSGLIYVMMGPLHGWNGYRAGSTLSAFDAKAGTPAEPPPVTP